MFTEKILKINPVVCCKNEAELIEAGKLFEENTTIPAWCNGSPIKFTKTIYKTYGRIQRTDEPAALVIDDTKEYGKQIKIFFGSPELFNRYNRLYDINQFKELFSNDN